MEIKLQPHQARNLAKVLDAFNLGAVPVITTSEAKEKLVYKTSGDIETMSYQNEPVVLKVDEAIVNSIPQVIEKFKEQELWYERFNEAIIKTLGQSDGAFFLALIASFSANTQLAQNLQLATRAYHALKSDINSNPELLKKFFDTLEQLKKKIKVKIQKSSDDSEYANLRYYKFIKVYSTLDNHLLMANYIADYYMTNGGKITAQDLASDISKYFKETGEVGKNKFTTGLKIFNFTMNLLIPGKSVEFNWFPTTIDTWMILFFYPFLAQDRSKSRDPEKEKWKKKQKMAIFASYKKYVYLAKIVQEQAEKFNMSPQGLQAVLWVATIKKHQPNATQKDIHGTLQYIVSQFNEDQQELNYMITFIEKIQKAIP